MQCSVVFDAKPCKRWNKISTMTLDYSGLAVKNSEKSNQAKPSSGRCILVHDFVDEGDTEFLYELEWETEPNSISCLHLPS